MSEIALPYFIALPAAAPPWPGVVVLHEGNGISTQLLRVCQRLAGEGYGAIAPDLFFRAGGTEAATSPCSWGRSSVTGRGPTSWRHRTTCVAKGRRRSA
jgi:carboxymethylenebutenolidase